MAIQYFMRAFNTNLSRYVDWVVNDTPDSTGQFSGFPIGQLINITVNRTVTSKIDNFLKPNQSLGGTDGNFFHVNSYDWKNATSPILPPTSLTGIAVERGISSVQPITGATNTSPISITTSSSHGLATGAIVTIIGVLGNIGANGTWPITVTSGTTFTLTGSTGTGAYTSGGTAYVPTSMSVLAWDEINQVWRFFFNTNGDGTTIGASQSVKVNNFIMDGYIAIGPDPADTGAIRLSNNTYIFSESNPPGADIQLIGGDLNNRIKLGNLTTDIVYDPGVLVVDGYIQHDGTGSNTAQTTGFIREQNGTNIIAFRGAGGLAGSDIVALGSNSTNNVILGDSVNTGILYETSTGSIHQFQVNNNPVFEIGTSFARFPSAVSAPFINQTTASSGSGQTLTIQAQQGAPGANAGGILQLASGALGSGGTVNGTVDIYTGAIGAANLKMRVFPTVASPTSNNNSIQYFENLFRVDAAQTNPLFRQDDQTTTASGNSYTIQAQNATLGSPSSGGNVVLVTGKGTSVSGLNDGYLFVQTGTGATTQIVVSPVNFPAMQYPTTNGKVVITGNLEVQGTTTTVDSTIVDIVGPVIHANWADPSTSPNVAIPSTNVGYSIHRGNAGNVPRDGAAWIWAEPRDLASGADGYWRALTIPGDGAGADQNFSIANSTNALGVMGFDFTASSDPNPVNGYLAASGSLRSTNNVPVSVARAITLTTTITAASNLAVLPQGTINVVSTTGFSTSGTILVLSSTGTQTITYTNTTGTSFTGCVGGSGTIITGGIVAQTNNSTTIAAGSNNVTLPTGTINVASTVGFPPSGILRIVTNVTAGSGTAQSVQTVTYTGGGGAGTTFTGCTGGTGTMVTGASVTSLPGGLTTLTQAFGTADNVLLGTDFGNRILHGSPSNNTGHIFNTATGFFYDFQVNSVSQFQVGQGEIDADGYTETLAIAPTVNNPRLYQITQPNTGANAGFNFKINAQQGQAVAAGTNNNGGALVLASGAVGTGGTGGTNGQMQFFWGNTLELTLTDGSLQWSNLIGTSPLISQADGVTNGTFMTMQAQNGTATGGNLVLTSGTGATLATAGNVKLQTGGVDRVVTYPTGSPANLPQGPSNTFYTEFRDAAQGVFIVPVSAGISSLGFASTVTGAQIAQVSTASTPSAPMTVQSQVTTAASGVGGNLNLIGGNATGTTSTGGNINLASGSGTTTNGVINFQPGGTTQILITATGQFIQWVSTMANPTINQATTGGASGTTLTVQAQNAATTGGDLTLTSGTGATTAGNVNLQTGAVSRVIVHPTFTEFRDTAEALRITPVSAGITQITFAATDTAAQINQTLTAAAVSADMTVQSQVTTAASGQGGNLNLIAGNATGTTSTGGNAILTSGTGTTVAGNTILQTGGVNKVVVQPTFVTFMGSAAAEALRITPVSNGTTEILFAKGVTSAVIDQTAQDAGAGANMTVHAQDGSTTGGNLNLSAGSGTVGGVVNLEIGLTPILTMNNNTLSWSSTVTTPSFIQTTTGSASGQALTVQAQNAATTGGDLNLTSGTGGTTNGSVNLQAGGSTTARVGTNKFTFLKGRRRNITSVSGTYAVLVTDDYLAVNTAAAPFTITLPSGPTTGDEYLIKDVSGNAGTNNVNISGNGNNIDGVANFSLNAAYQSITVTFTGSQWSVT